MDDAAEFPRCSLCGGYRIPRSQQGAGTCTFLECKDPLNDNRTERPTFPRSSQNQKVSSGVEGAHEGTAADKSESREPEKLNNAQNTNVMVHPVQCASCSEIQDSLQARHNRCYRCGEPLPEYPAASPELLPTQPDTKND